MNEEWQGNMDKIVDSISKLDIAQGEIDRLMTDNFKIPNDIANDLKEQILKARELIKSTEICEQGVVNLFRGISHLFPNLTEARVSLLLNSKFKKD